MPLDVPMSLISQNPASKLFTSYTPINNKLLPLPTPYSS